MILVIHAHPYPSRSLSSNALLATVRDMPDVEVRSLYDLYPDFDIDVAAEQRALEEAKLVVLLHPIYWYTAPALLKHWFEHVLVKGWAFGEGGTALAGKDCLWVVSTGGDEHAYTPAGRHHHPFTTFVPVVEQTMRYCGMHWLEPQVTFAGHQKTPEDLQALGLAFRTRIDEWRKEARNA